jgi:flagellar export protein FliJ
MARFVFRLSGVLRHRRHIERQRQRELAVLEARMAVQRSLFAELDQSVRASLDDLRRNRLIGRIDVAFLQAHRRYMIAMRKKAFDMAADMAALQQQIDAARAALIRAATDRKALDLLRERRKSEWLADQNRREIAELDEVGLQMGHLDAADEAAAMAAAQAAGDTQEAIVAGVAQDSLVVETASW